MGKGELRDVEESICDSQRQISLTDHGCGVEGWKGAKAGAGDRRLPCAKSTAAAKFQNHWTRGLRQRSRKAFMVSYIPNGRRKRRGGKERRRESKGSPGPQDSD